LLQLELQVKSHYQPRHNYDVISEDNTFDLQGLDRYGDVEM
jgi:hypothetical protein